MIAIPMQVLLCN